MRVVIETLQSLTNLGTFALVCGTLVVLTPLMPLLRRKLLRVQISDEVGEGVQDAFKSIATFIVFVMAFSLVQEERQFHDAEETVQKEASALNLTDRALYRFGLASATEARGALQTYAKSVVNDEWKLLAKGGRSRETGRFFGELYRKVRTIEPDGMKQGAQFAELIGLVDRISDLREERLSASENGLPTLFWWTIFSLLAVLLLMSAFTTGSLQMNLSQTGIVCAIGLLLSLVIIYDGPFSGETSVSPTPIVRVLGRMSERG